MKTDGVVDEVAAGVVSAAKGLVRNPDPFSAKIHLVFGSKGEFLQENSNYGAGSSVAYRLVSARVNDQKEPLSPMKLATLAANAYSQIGTA